MGPSMPHLLKRKLLALGILLPFSFPLSWNTENQRSTITARNWGLWWGWANQTETWASQRSCEGGRRANLDVPDTQVKGKQIPISVKPLCAFHHFCCSRLHSIVLMNTDDLVPGWPTHLALTLNLWTSNETWWVLGAHSPLTKLPAISVYPPHAAASVFVDLSLEYRECEQTLQMKGIISTNCSNGTLRLQQISHEKRTVFLCAILKALRLESHCFWFLRFTLNFFKKSA